jgi:hypothetical protein
MRWNGKPSRISAPLENETEKVVGTDEPENVTVMDEPPTVYAQLWVGKTNSFPVLTDVCETALEQDPPALKVQTVSVMIVSPLEATILVFRQLPSSCVAS